MLDTHRGRAEHKNECSDTHKKKDSMDCSAYSPLVGEVKREGEGAKGRGAIYIDQDDLQFANVWVSSASVFELEMIRNRARGGEKISSIMSEWLGLNTRGLAMESSREECGERTDHHHTETIKSG